MKLSTIFTALVILGLGLGPGLGMIGGGTARAQGWDRRGWVKLGEREVNGRIDRDRIEVGRYEGRFSKLTMFVENSDLELIDFRIVFGDRPEHPPQLRHAL